MKRGCQSSFQEKKLFREEETLCLIITRSGARVRGPAGPFPFSFGG